MSQKDKVFGFQFVRRIQKNDSDSSGESCYESLDADEVRVRDIPVEGWCKCGSCSEMPTDRENVCCSNLESTSLFELKGK